MRLRFLISVLLVLVCLLLGVRFGLWCDSISQYMALVNTVPKNARIRQSFVTVSIAAKSFGHLQVTIKNFALPSAVMRQSHGVANQVKIQNANGRTRFPEH